MSGCVDVSVDGLIGLVEASKLARACVDGLNVGVGGEGRDWVRMGVHGCVRQRVSEGVSVRRLSLDMQLRAGGGYCLCGPPCWCREVQSRPRPHSEKRKPTRALAVSASCGFPHHECTLERFTFITGSSLPHANTVAVAVANGQRVTLLYRLSYDTTVYSSAPRSEAFLVDLHTWGRDGRKEYRDSA